MTPLSTAAVVLRTLGVLALAAVALGASATLFALRLAGLGRPRYRY